MSIDETVKALRNCAYNNSCDGCSFALVMDDEDCKDNMMLAAADQLEQLQAENSMLKSGNRQILEDYKLCVAERDELKASQPVRCGECIYKNNDEESCYCEHGLGGWNLRADNYCSYGERRGAE